jgi:Uma2 family endonuclease
MMTAPVLKNDTPMSVRKVRVSNKRRLNYDDYARLTPPDSGSYELHNGQIIIMPTPTPRHQRLSMRLSHRLYHFVDTHQLGEIFTAPMDTVFTPHDVLQPDLLFLSTEKLHLIGAKKIEGAPDLVVEILSPSNVAREMSYKKHVYEFSGVREYWVVNLEKQSVTQYENIEGEFFLRRVFQKTEILTSIILTGFETPLETLFES